MPQRGARNRRPRLRVLIHTVLRPGFVKPAKGALAPLKLATDPALAEVSGRFFRKATEQRWAERCCTTTCG